MPFTDRQIAALRPKAERYEKAEPGRTGLRIRVNTDGSKTWTFIYRFDGRQKRMVLGHYQKAGLKPDQTMSLAKAHVALAQAKDKLRAGIDPGAEIAEAREAERNAETFAELVEQYIKRHVEPNLKASTAAEERRTINCDCLPALGHMKVKDIARRDIVRVLDGIEERGALVQYNRTAGAFSRLFKFAVKRGIIEASPALYLHERRFDNPEGRDRVLTKREIFDLWHGLDGIAVWPTIPLAIKFALVTGQRRAECAGAMRSEIDDEAALWLLPGERTKNHKPNLIPLSPLAMGLVREADAHRVRPKPVHIRPSRPYDPTPVPYLFASRHKSGPIKPDTLTAILNRHRDTLRFGDARFHDLRRTCASALGALGTHREIISALLNHTPPGVTSRYVRAPMIEQRRAAMEKYSDWLALVVAGDFDAAERMETEAEIVSFDRAVA